MTNEREYAHRLCRYLDRSAEGIAAGTARSLHDARVNALAHAGAGQLRAGLAGGGLVSIGEFVPAIRATAAVMVLAAAAAGFSYWNSLEQASELAEVDTALLAEELPINAYLDQGFSQWLTRSSPE